MNVMCDVQCLMYDVVSAKKLSRFFYNPCPARVLFPPDSSGEVGVRLNKKL